MKDNILSVLHSPVNIGNQPWVLSRYERSLGINSELVVNYNTWLNYKADVVLGEYASNKWREIIKRGYFGLTAPFKYDVFHYYFGRSLLFWDDLPKWNCFPYADMKIAKALGKKIFMTFQGCDVRLAGESDLRNKYTPCRQGYCSVYKTCIDSYDAKRKKMINEVTPYCDHVFYLNPELGHYVPNGIFMPYASVDIGSIIPVSLPKKASLRIVHAPSDSSIKGTDQVLSALGKLKDKYDFELILVQGKTHSEAIELYKSADIAIDQIYLGWYGSFAVEIMAMGKPVICYIREEDLGFIPANMRDELPILRVEADTLEKDLDKILQQCDQWIEIGQRSRKYVEKWHDPARIAKVLVEAYSDPSDNFKINSLAFGN